MQAKTLSLFIALSLAMASLACAQGEKQDQGQKQGQEQILAQAEKHDEDAKGHSHEAAELHDGAVIMTPKHHFEVIFAPEEVRVYGYDREQKPISEMKDAKVTLTLRKKDGDPKELALDYVGPETKAGRSQGYFAAAYEFGKVEEGQMKATFNVSGVGKEPIKFKTAVSVSGLVTYACPMHPDITGEDPVECSKCGMALVKQAHDEDADHEKNEHSHEGHDH